MLTRNEAAFKAFWAPKLAEDLNHKKWSWTDEQVDKVKAVWGASIGFALGTSRDHRDIYNWQLQLYERHDASRQRIKLYKAARSVAAAEQEAEMQAAEQEADSRANAD